MSRRVQLQTRCGCKREIDVPASQGDSIKMPFLRVAPAGYWHRNCPRRNTYVGHRTFEYHSTLTDGVEVFMEVE